jgi:Protein of unknown function (DUF5818)
MKKILSILATLTLGAALVPAVFAQQDQSSRPSSAPQQDQTSPAQQPSATQPSTSPSAAPSAQEPSAQPSAQQPSSSSASSSSMADSSSFSGTVVKAGDKFVLKSGSQTYQIDDQDKAKQFEGKEVKVNGTLDKATSMIRVTDISPADNK